MEFIKVENTTGKVVIINTCGYAISPREYTTSIIAATISGQSVYGISIMELYIIGKPKITGSLILNIPGTNPAFATALILFDLLFNPITHSASVLPVPPMILSAPNKNRGDHCRGCPAAARAEFVEYAAIYGIIIALKITPVPWMPKNQKSWLSIMITNIPGVEVR